MEVVANRKAGRQLAHAEHERIVLRVIREDLHFVIMVDAEAARDIAWCTVVAARTHVNTHDSPRRAVDYNELPNLALRRH